MSIHAMNLCVRARLALAALGLLAMVGCSSSATGDSASGSSGSGATSTGTTGGATAASATSSTGGSSGGASTSGSTGAGCTASLSGSAAFAVPSTDLFVDDAVAGSHIEKVYLYDAPAWCGHLTPQLPPEGSHAYVQIFFDAHGSATIPPGTWNIVGNNDLGYGDGGNLSVTLEYDHFVTDGGGSTEDTPLVAVGGSVTVAADMAGTELRGSYAVVLYVPDGGTLPASGAFDAAPCATCSP